MTDHTTNRFVRRPIARSIVSSWYLNRTINRGARRQIVQPIVTHGDRSYDHSWHPATDYIFWYQGANDCWTTSRKVVQLVAPTNMMSYNGWHHKLSEGTTSCTTSRVTAWSAIIHNHVVRPYTTGGTITYNQSDTAYDYDSNQLLTAG